MFWHGFNLLFSKFKAAFAIFRNVSLVLTISSIVFLIAESCPYSAVNGSSKAQCARLPNFFR